MTVRSGLWALLLVATSTPAAAQVDVQAVAATSRSNNLFLEDVFEVDVELDWPQGSYSGPLDVRIHISTDAVLDPADHAAFTQTLTVTSTETARLVAGPVPARRGTFFVIAELDPDDRLTETDENNNIVASANPVNIIGGDLEVLRLFTVGPAQGFRGEPLDYRVEYRNRGPSAVENVQLVVELRPSASPAMEVLRTPPETLGPTASRILVESLDVPENARTGPAELTARILSTDPVEEDPLNDVEIITFPIRDPVPDLRGQIIATSTAIEAGERLIVNRVVENAGFVDAPATDILYVLSEDDELVATDLQLGRVPVPALAVDEIDVRSDRLTVPVTTSPGSYRLGFLMDPDGAIEEVDDDNAVAGPRIDVFAPDLTVATESLPPARLDIPYEVALVAVGGPSPAYFWTLVEGSVPGVGLDGATGILSGRPTQEGTFPIRVRVESGTARAERALELRVVEGAVELSLEDRRLPAAIIGRPYAQTLIPTGGVEPFEWTALDSPPSGLELAASGQLAGVVTETATGTFAFEVQVRDATGAEARAELTLAVVELSQRVTLLVDPLPDATVGAPYCNPDPVQLRAVGEFPPFVFSAGSPPSGLALSADGRLCGTPDRVGTSTFAVNVRDDLGLVDDGVFQLRVGNDDSVRIVTETLPVAEVGRFYEAQIRAEGGVAPYRFDLSVGDLPPGYALEPGGRVVGTSTAAGRFRFAVRATDVRGASRQAGYDLVVVRPAAEDEGCSCAATSRAPGAAAGWLAAGLAVGLGRRLRRRRGRA